MQERGIFEHADLIDVTPAVLDKHPDEMQRPWL